MQSVHLCCIQWSFLGKDGSKHLIPLLKHSRILTDEVVRDRDFNVILDWREGLNTSLAYMIDISMTIITPRTSWIMNKHLQSVGLTPFI